MALARCSGLLFLLCVAPACDTILGGDFGHDPDAAIGRMHKITALFPPGELQVEAVSEPGDGITHIRFVYAAARPTCAEPMMATICAETGSIRKATGAKVEAWCHGSPPASPQPVEGCVDGRRLPRFTR